MEVKDPEAKETSLFSAPTGVDKQDDLSIFFRISSQEGNAFLQLVSNPTEESGAPCTPANQIRHTPVLTSSTLAFHSPVPSQRVPYAQTPVKQRRTVHRNLGAPRVNRGNAGSASQRRSGRKIAKVEGTNLQFSNSAEQTPIRMHTSEEANASRRFKNTLNLFSSPTRTPFPGHSSSNSSQMELLHSFSQLQLPPQSVDAMDLSPVEAEYSVHPPRIITEFQEIKELGSGTFGRVALYKEDATGFYVAVKSLPSHPTSCLHRYRREKLILSLVRGNPHTIQLLGAWEENSRLFLQFAYCAGGSVAALAERKRKNNEKWEEPELLVFTMHMCIALDALHRLDIAHVDFKPENVLIDSSGSYQLSDFGCSVILNKNGNPREDFGAHINRGGRSSPWTPTADSPSVDQHSMNSFDEGDCRYLCSDMLNQKMFIREGDVFALGMSLFELMSGDPLPATGEEFCSLRQSVPTNVLRERGYGEQLIQLVVSLLQEDPLLRPSARSILQALASPSPLLSSLVKNEQTLSEWTRNANSLDNLVKAGITTPLQFRYFCATMESTSYLLETTRADYERALGIHTVKGK